MLYHGIHVKFRVFVMLKRQSDFIFATQIIIENGQ